MTYPKIETFKSSRELFELAPYLGELLSIWQTEYATSPLARSTLEMIINGEKSQTLFKPYDARLDYHYVAPSNYPSFLKSDRDFAWYPANPLPTLTPALPLSSDENIHVQIVKNSSYPMPYPLIYVNQEPLNEYDARFTAIPRHLESIYKLPLNFVTSPPHVKPFSKRCVDNTWEGIADSEFNDFLDTQKRKPPLNRLNHTTWESLSSFYKNYLEIITFVTNREPELATTYFQKYKIPLDINLGSAPFDPLILLDNLWLHQFVGLMLKPIGEFELSQPWQLRYNTQILSGGTSVGSGEKKAWWTQDAQTLSDLFLNIFTNFQSHLAISQLQSFRSVWTHTLEGFATEVRAELSLAFLACEYYALAHLGQKAVKVIEILDSQLLGT